NPRTLRAVSRGVDARTGQVVASKSNEAGPEEATGQIPALRADVVGLRFFVSSTQDAAKREYDDLFFYNAAHYIYWQLNLVHPVLEHQASVTLEEVWKGPGGAIAWRATHVYSVAADSTTSGLWNWARLVGTKTVDIPNQFYEDCLRRQRQPLAGPCSPTTGVDIQRWQRGVYEVEIFVDKRLV